MSYALEIAQLYKTYDNGFTALKGISLQVERGDFFAFCRAHCWISSSVVYIWSCSVERRLRIHDICGLGYLIFWLGLW